MKRQGTVNANRQSGIENRQSQTAHYENLSRISTSYHTPTFILLDIK